MKNSPGFAHLLLIAGLAIVLIGGMFYFKNHKTTSWTKSPDPAHAQEGTPSASLSNWTYTKLASLNGADGGDYADWDGNGTEDFCVASEEGKKAVCYTLNGATVTKAVTVMDWNTRNKKGPQGPEDVAIGDLTGDGKPDLAYFLQGGKEVGFGHCTNNTISSTCSKVKLITTPYETHNGFIKDIDGDGNQDIVYASSVFATPTGEEIAWLENPLPLDPKVPANWPKHIINSDPQGSGWGFAEGGQYNRIDLFDLNGNGDQYLIVSERRTNKVSFFKKPANPLTESWVGTTLPVNNVSADMGHMSIQDIDGDNDLDILLKNSPIVIWENQGNLTFAQHTVDSVNNPSGVGLHKLEGPGDTDFEIVVNEYNQSSATKVYVYKKNTLDSWTKYIVYSQNFAGDDIFFDDLNGNGFDDIISTWDGSGTGEVYTLLH